MSKPKNLFVYVSFAFLLMAVACASRVKFEIAARSQPGVTLDSLPHSYALIVNIDPDSVSSLIEKNILSLVGQTLEKRGWILKDSTIAEFVFEVSFEMQQSQEYSQEGAYTWYDDKGRPHLGGGSASTQTVNIRKVSILAYSKTSSLGQLVWSADCISAGSTADILLPAQYMVPFAIEHFPRAGNWHGSASIKK